MKFFEKFSHVEKGDSHLANKKSLNAVWLSNSPTGGKGGPKEGTLSAEHTFNRYFSVVSSYETRAKMWLKCDRIHPGLKCMADCMASSGFVS